MGSPFGPDDHQTLTSAGIGGFRASEDILPIGVRVRIKGWIRRTNGELVLEMKELVRLEVTEAPSGGAAPGPGRSGTARKSRKPRANAGSRLRL